MPLLFLLLFGISLAEEVQIVSGGYPTKNTWAEAMALQSHKICCAATFGSIFVHFPHEIAEHLGANFVIFLSTGVADVTGSVTACWISKVEASGAALCTHGKYITIW